MKILKSQKIASFQTDLKIKAKNGATIKWFTSNSTVDFSQADQNCYKRAYSWTSTIITFLKKEKSYLNEYETRPIIGNKVTLKEMLDLKNKISKLIIKPVIKEIEI